MLKTKVNCMWEQRVINYNASGEVLKTWCNLNHVKPARLRYWMRELKANDDSAEKSSSWLSIDTAKLNVVTKEDHLIVKIGNSSIEVNSGFDKDLFSEVTKVLLELC